MQYLWYESSVMAKIGLIGCGMWGHNLARNLAQLDALVAVADRKAEAANEFASTFNATAMSVDALIEHSDIDGIVIATSAPSHEKLALAGLVAKNISTLRSPYHCHLPVRMQSVMQQNLHNGRLWLDT